jgi:hypothetical protein
MRLPRRRFLHLAAGAAAFTMPVPLVATMVTQAQTPPDIRVTLLGTGTPNPIVARSDTAR